MQWDGYGQVSAGGRQYGAAVVNSANQALGAKGGAIGDTLDFVWCFPATLTPGVLTILDGATVLWTMAGATLLTLQPFPIPMNIKSVVGGFKITTGLNMTALAVGLFT